MEPIKGYDTQQYDGKADIDRPNNLYEPVQGNYGAHGDFDHLASCHSFQVWISRYRKWIFIILGVLFLGYLCLMNYL